MLAYNFQNNINKHISLLIENHDKMSIQEKCSTHSNIDTYTIHTHTFIISAVGAREREERVGIDWLGLERDGRYGNAGIAHLRR